MAYINKAELVENLDKFAPEHFSDLIKTLIEKQPTADVVEVKHGYWKEYFSAGKFHYDCSVCDDGFATKEILKTVPNYCSNCGAKMDGRGNEE